MDTDDDRSHNPSSDRMTKRDDDGTARKRRQSLSARSETPGAELPSRRRRSSTSVPNGVGPAPHRHSPRAQLQHSSIPFTVDEAPANTADGALSPQSEPPAPDSQHPAQGVTPYGTRSRNRTGGSRPNYAEDHDFDLEVEPNNLTARSGGSKRSSMAPNDRYLTVEPEKPQGMNTRRGFTAVNGSVALSSNSSAIPKELIPGTSTFSANPTIPQNGSKKRKQPGGTTATTTQSQQTHGLSGKGRNAVREHHDTSMMSFEASQGHLQNGRLIADDGTSLQVNGTRRRLHKSYDLR